MYLRGFYPALTLILCLKQMSAPAQEYCAKGESEDFAQALDCIAALADANLVQQTVLFV